MNEREGFGQRPAGSGVDLRLADTRGPITTGQALVSVAVALAVGLGAGLTTDTRWSLLATPAVFAVVFEVARMGTVGPTVDAIDLSGFFWVVGCDGRRPPIVSTWPPKAAATAGADNARTTRWPAQAWSPTRRHRGVDR